MSASMAPETATTRANGLPGNDRRSTKPKVSFIGSETIPPDKWLSFALAFVGGYSDAASVVLAKTFTGHVTGSLVLAAVAIAAHEWRALLTHLSAVLFFLTGVFFGVLIGRALAASPSWQPLPTVVGIEVILTMTAYLALASRAAPGA